MRNEALPIIVEDATPCVGTNAASVIYVSATGYAATDANLTWDATSGLTLGKTIAISGHTTFTQKVAPTAPTTAVNPAAGNLTGTYWYSVSFVTAIGETEPSALSLTVAPSSQQVDLTNIPVGPAGVTARKIYRSKRTTPFTGLGQQLVTTINDNRTTNYTDNIADGSVVTYGKYINTTGGVSYNGATVIAAADPAVTIFGYGAGAINAGIRNTFIGYWFDADLRDVYRLCKFARGCDIRLSRSAYPSESAVRILIWQIILKPCR